MATFRLAASIAPSKHVNTKGCRRAARRGACRSDPWATSCISPHIINGGAMIDGTGRRWRPDAPAGTFSLFGDLVLFATASFLVVNPYTPLAKAVTRRRHAEKKILLAASASKPVARSICVWCCRFNAALCFFFFFSQRCFFFASSLHGGIFCGDMKDYDLEPCRQLGV